MITLLYRVFRVSVQFLVIQGSHHLLCTLIISGKHGSACRKNHRILHQFFTHVKTHSNSILPEKAER